MTSTSRKARERLDVELGFEDDAPHGALVELAGQVVDAARADRHVGAGQEEGAAPDFEAERTVAAQLPLQRAEGAVEQLASARA